MSDSDQPIVHTPWTIEPHGNGYALYSGRGPMTHGMNLVYLSEPDSNWESTKRLIEAVPLMLEALRDCLSDYCEPSEMMHGRCFSTGNIVRDAIEKATGVRPAEVV